MEKEKRCKAKGKKIAIEVESGNTIKKDKKRLMNKIKLLKKYDDWFFVVTDGAFAYKYEKIAKTFTRSNICQEISKYF